MLKRILLLGFGVCALASVSTGQYSYNQAASFDGSISYVSIPNSSELNPTSAITVEAWIFPTGDYSTSRMIYAKNYTTSTALGIQVNSGRLVFIPKGGGSVGLLSKVSSVIPLSSWTHVAATYDGATTAIYLNGVLDTSTTSITGAIGVNTDSAFIGCDRPAGVPSLFFSGIIDEVRTWNVARSAAEIARDRFIPLAIIAVTSAGGAYNGLTNAWRLNGTVFDEAGFENNSGTAHTVSYVDIRQKPENYVDYNNTLLLDGVNGYCATYPFSVFNATTAVTLEAWIKRDTIGTGQPIELIVSKSNASAQNYYMFWNDRRLGFGTSSAFRVASDTILNTNAWYHVAATYNSANGRSILYVNGDSVASATASGNPAIQNDPDSVFIGASMESSSLLYKFKGQIDEVRIWKDVVRTRDEIRANMYKSIDFTTSPLLPNLGVYGFDGRNSIETSQVGSVPHVRFNGTARLTSAHRQINAEPTSPLLRDEAGGFGGPTYVVSRRLLNIPDNTPAGVTDSVFVSATGVATGVKLFVLLNHTFTGDLTISLTGPTGLSVNVFTRRGGGNNDIMAVFDDNADSVAGGGSASGFLAPFSPLVKPNNPLSAFGGTNRQGWWKLKVVDAAGLDIGRVFGWGVQTSPLVDVNPVANLAEGFELLQNYPNPFNPSTTIRFTIPRESDVNLSVYNILGQHVTTLVQERMKRGSYSIPFNGQNFSSGTYFYRITTGDYVDTKKMMILK